MGGLYEQLVDVIVSRYSVDAQIPSTLLQGQQRNLVYHRWCDHVFVKCIVPELLYKHFA